MSPKDFDFAVQITDQKQWDLSKDDFKFMTWLEPKGCFVLLSDSEKIGIATTVSCGRVGWFGNLIVKKTHRNKGAGSLLVIHAVKYLRNKGVETIGLYSYLDTIPFYENLGFKHDSDFTVLRGKAASSQTEEKLKKARKSDLQHITRLDQACFGGDRTKLLKALLQNPRNLCYVSREDGQMQGYVVVKIYDGTAELGPLVCNFGHNEIAVNLLKGALNRLAGSEVTMCVPSKENRILNMLKRLGFHEDFCVARMFNGPAISSKCICLAESLERG